MMDSATTALQNGACTYRCISKQMHYKTPFSHNCYMKSLEFYKNYITLFCLEKKLAFLTQNHAWHVTQSGWKTIWYKQQLRNNTILSHALFRMHSNVMLCFMMQELQDPTLCSSTVKRHFSLSFADFPGFPSRGRNQKMHGSNLL